MNFPTQTFDRTSSLLMPGKLIPINRKPLIPFEIRTLETTLPNSSFSRDLPFIQDFYEIMWIKKGRGYFKSEGKVQHLKENFAYLLSPGQIYTLKVENQIEGYSISFFEEFLCLTGIDTSDAFRMRSYANDLIFQEIHMDKDMLAKMELIVMNMINEYSNSHFLKSELLVGLLKILIIYLSRNCNNHYRESTDVQVNRISSKFIYLVDKNFKNKKKVSQYAEELSITPNHLCTVVKISTGFPASFHIYQRIILEAKRKAIFSVLNMKGIAYELGFTDTSHFSKFFKINYGMSFSDFKKHITATKL